MDLNYREIRSCLDCKHCTVTMFCSIAKWIRVDKEHICDMFERIEEVYHDPNRD